ncbi:MAG: D-glycero-D-manno-heptose 1,7-bisphosphate phosphatase, partial [Sphingobacteriales bacterium]
FAILPGVLDAFLALKNTGIKIAVITNQGGIAKGIYTAKAVIKLHTNFNFYLKRNGAQPVNKFYFCPHHNELGNCLCRKPKSLMLEKALADFNISPDEALFFGDSDRDVVAGEKAGVTSVLLNKNGNLWEQIGDRING